MRFAECVEEGRISEDDANKFTSFVGMTNHPSFGIFILAKGGKLAHMEKDEGFQATMRVLDTMDLGNIEVSQLTSMPPEEQFWQQCDGFLQLTEAGMRKDLPHFITDPANLAKVQALLSGSDDAAAAVALKYETTRQIA